LLLPVSYQEKLRTAFRDIEHADADYKLEKSLTALGGAVSDVSTKLALLLDREMNEVWKKFNNRDPGKNKANVYFPMRKTLAEFDAYLQKSQLGTLNEKSPRTYDFLHSIQPFSTPEYEWLSKMLEVASTRHESDAEIEEKRITTSIGLGAGQNLYIKAMTIRNGNISFSGNAFDQSGAIQPLNIERTEEILAFATSAGKPAIAFLKDCHRGSGKLLRDLRSCHD